MMQWRVAAVIGLVLAAGSGSFAEDAAKTEPAKTKAGFAERDITPEFGMEQPGGYGKVFHQALHDPCKVRAAVFDDGTNRVALVGVDALMIRREEVEAARKAITEKCGIPGEAVLIGASHSHSSGPTGMIAPGEFDDASEFIQDLAYKKSSNADTKYLKTLVDQIVDAVCAADEARAEVSCGIGKGIEDRVAFNRRFRMRGGFTATHPGRGNPDIVEVAGPTDPEVGVIGVWNSEGKLVGCVVNFVCHATTNPGGISANYVYYLEKTIRGVMGPDVVVVFLAGASGDVTQVDNLSPFVGRSGERDAEFVGGRVGAEAVKVLFSMERGALLPVAAKQKVLTLERRKPSKARVERAMEIVQADPAKADPTEWTFAKETVLVDHLVRTRPTAEVEVQAVQVGPAVFVTNPAEYFCQFGLDIKAGSHFPFTFPVSLANGCVGYVPTEEAFGPRGGGYETRLTAYSNLRIDAGKTIRDTGIELANQLKPGEVPLRAKAPPFVGQPWTYGNVPPEVE